MVAPLTVGAGWTVGPGWTLGPSNPTGNGFITYTEMDPPVVPGNQLEDGTATVNDPIGFTINDGGATGVAVIALTNDNIIYYDNLGTGTFTANLGAGSSSNTISVQVVQTPTPGAPGFGNALVFFFDPTATYPLTVNFPIFIY